MNNDHRSLILSRHLPADTTGGFVSFQGSSGLYTDLAAHRDSEWLACISGCRGLAGIFGRAQSILSRPSRARDDQDTAAIAAMDLGTRGSVVVPRLFACLEASFAAGGAPGNDMTSLRLFKPLATMYSVLGNAASFPGAQKPQLIACRLPHHSGR